jgi:hypothetical protein
VRGALLVLTVDGQRYEYHADASGELIYCATPEAPIGPLD